MIIQKNTDAILTLAFFFLLMTALCADTAKEPQHVRPYRGMRMPHKGGVFYVKKIEIEIERDDKARNIMVEIALKFNMPVDPRTLQRNLIYINEKPLPADAQLSFNKAGDKIKILMQAAALFAANQNQPQPLHIMLPEARSFNALPLYHNRFDDLYCEKEYTFKLSAKLPKSRQDSGSLSRDTPRRWENAAVV